jgi:hypothetical protein
VLTINSFEAGGQRPNPAARVHQEPQVAMLEHPGADPSVVNLRDIADARGARLELELVA